MTEPAEREDRILRIAKVDTDVKPPRKAKTMEQSSAELCQRRNPLSTILLFMP